MFSYIGDDFNATTACCNLWRKVLNDSFNNRQQLPAVGNKMRQHEQKFDFLVVLWSLELASEIFHDFFAYDSGGKDLDSALTSRTKFQKEHNTVARNARSERNLALRKGEGRALWSEGSHDRNVDRNCVSSTSVFLIRTASPVSSDRK